MKNLDCRTTEQGTLQSWVGSFQCFFCCDRSVWRSGSYGPARSTSFRHGFGRVL